MSQWENSERYIGYIVQMSSWLIFTKSTQHIACLVYRQKFAVQYVPAVLFSKQVWKIIGHIGAFIMDLLWWSHLVAPLCISSLLSVNYTWFTRCLRDSQCEAAICEWVIALERERRWQDISFINMAACPSIIPCRIGVSHFSDYSCEERPFPGIQWESACDFYEKVQTVEGFC